MEEHQKIIQLLEKRNRLDMNELKKLFFMMRNGNLKLGDALMEIGLKLTRTFKNQLGKECKEKNKKHLYCLDNMILQELFYTTIDLHLIHTSDQILKVLLQQYNKSEKIIRLKENLNSKGVILEANGMDDDAQVIYEKMIQENLLDQGSRKRRIAMQRKKENVDEAINQLNTYLTSFPQDNESWLELADIYLEGMNYSKALFCYEELLMLTPNDQHYIIKLAELNYSTGNLEFAKNYYCFVLSKNCENMRGLWGLLQTLKRWAKFIKSDKTAQLKNKELAELIVETIQAAYKKKGQQTLIQNYPFQQILSQL